MNEIYTQELQQSIDFYFKQLVYLEGEIDREREYAKNTGDYKDYGHLMRLYVPIQKEYLRLCAEQERLTDSETAADPLLDFAATGTPA